MEGSGGVNNLTPYSVDEEKILSVAREVIKEEKGHGEVTFALLGKEEIREINCNYRGKDYATDVLSFLYSEGDLLGEVLLCPEKIEEDAEKERFEKAFFRVAIHGILHLLGYDHEKGEKEEKEMKEKTDYYLRLLE